MKSKAVAARVGDMQQETDEAEQTTTRTCKRPKPGGNPTPSVRNTF